MTPTGNGPSQESEPEKSMGGTASLEVQTTVEIGRTLVVLRAALTLLLVALAAWGLSLLCGFGAPQSRRTSRIIDGAGNEVWLIFSRPIPGPKGQRPPIPVNDVTAVLARVPVRVAPRRNLLELPGGDRRVLPPYTTTILVSKDLRVEVLGGPLPRIVVLALANLGARCPIPFPRWFHNPKNQNVLDHAQAWLKDFWK